MILPDVDVLVHAFRADTEHHERYRTWLEDVLRRGTPLALPDHCAAGFVRIVTNPRIFEDPAPTTAALALVDRLHQHPRTHRIMATTATWELLATWAEEDRGLRGNLVPDAYLAALAVSHGARLATADRGVARFPGLEHLDPGA